MRARPAKPDPRAAPGRDRALCAELGLAGRRPPSNDDPAFRRNRVRHELLPLLDAIAERDVAALLARQAALLADDAALLDELAAAIDPTDAGALAAAPVALARRAVRRWLRADPPARRGRRRAGAGRGAGRRGLRRAGRRVGGGRAARLVGSGRHG